MESMVDNGEEWMEPLLEIQRELSSHKDPQIKKKIREIKRRDGRVWKAKSKEDRKTGSRNWTKAEGEYIPGPYKIGYRKELLRKILLAQQSIRVHGPDPKACLIREDELKAIRDIWRTESQEWEDSIPKIFNDIFGEEEILLGLLLTPGTVVGFGLGHVSRNLIPDPVVRPLIIGLSFLSGLFVLIRALV